MNTHKSHSAAPHSAWRRVRHVALFVLVIAVIDVGNAQRANASENPGNCGFTRIARDLGRQFAGDQDTSRVGIMASPKE
jgi:hypothetical protein